MGSDESKQKGAKPRKTAKFIIIVIIILNLLSRVSYYV